MVIHRTSNGQQLPVPYSAKKKGLVLENSRKSDWQGASGTPAHPPAAGSSAQPPMLPDWWMIRWTLPTNTANILWTTTSLIFMWTADGTGSRGTGWTVSENRSCMDYMPLPILFGQSACTFQRHGVSDSGSLLLDFISSTADSIGKKYADPCRRYHRRLVLGGILYRVPADSHSGGGDLRCSHRTYQKGNHKAIHAVVNFVVVFVLSAAFIAYALIISGKSMNFPQTSAMPA